MAINDLSHLAACRRENVEYPTGCGTLSILPIAPGSFRHDDRKPGK
jgi:hypothetical protein